LTLVSDERHADAPEGDLALREMMTVSRYSRTVPVQRVPEQDEGWRWYVFAQSKLPTGRSHDVSS
jgi:hypothetical protein